MPGSDERLPVRDPGKPGELRRATQKDIQGSESQDAKKDPWKDAPSTVKDPGRPYKKFEDMKDEKGNHPQQEESSAKTTEMAPADANTSFESGKGKAELKQQGPTDQGKTSSFKSKL